MIDYQIGRSTFALAVLLLAGISQPALAGDRVEIGASLAGSYSAPGLSVRFGDNVKAIAGKGIGSGHANSYTSIAASASGSVKVARKGFQQTFGQVTKKKSTGNALSLSMVRVKAGNQLFTRVAGLTADATYANGKGSANAVAFSKSRGFSR